MNVLFHKDELAANPSTTRAIWWRSAVVYQIYTRSFCDSDGDGNGDLKGITQKLDYLAALGIDCVWLTPFFKSPAMDQGYDPASYHKVDPRFGTNADLFRLIQAAHDHNIKVILDLVLNHTSDQHPWFLRSLKPDLVKRRIESGYDADVDPFANIYVFQPANPAAPNQPPNNWKHFMGDVSAWTKAPTGEWYLHRFTPWQPDLNSRNPLVERHFLTIVRRWIGELKIDGIRIDVLDHVFHDKQLRDFDPIPHPVSNNYMDQWDWPARYLLDDEAVALARKISHVIRHTNENAVSIGEIHYSDRVANFCHYRKFLVEGEIDLPFNFSLLSVVQQFGVNVREWKKVIDRYMAALPHGACPNFVMSNHDQIMRLIDRVGKENIRAVTMALLCLGDKGGSNIFMYNGDEIGMEKGKIINASNLNDPIGKLQGIELSRDHVRTGFVWDTTKPNSGFTTSNTPWLPVGQTAYGTGAEQQATDPNSLLAFIRNVIHLRREFAVLRFGAYVPYDVGDDAVFCFGRDDRDKSEEEFIIVFNFSMEKKDVKLPKEVAGEVICSTIGARHSPIAVNKKISLEPHEGCIIRVLMSVH